MIGSYTPTMSTPVQVSGTYQPNVGPASGMGHPGPGMGYPGPVPEPPGTSMGYPSPGPPGPSMGYPSPVPGPPGPSMGYPSPGPQGPSMGYPSPVPGPPGPSMGYGGPSMGYAGPGTGYPGPSMGYPGPSSAPSVGYTGPNYVPSTGYPGPSYVSSMGYSGPSFVPSTGYPGPNSVPSTGYPGPSMEPPGPSTSILGASGSGTPSLPPQVKPVVPSYNIPVQPVNHPGEDVWVQAVTSSGQVYYYNSRTCVSTWTRPQNVMIITQAELQILAPGSAGTGISESNPQGSEKMETTQDYWNTVCKTSHAVEVHPEQTQVSKWTEYTNPAVVIDNPKNYFYSAFVRPSNLVFLQAKNNAADVSQPVTSVHRNAPKDVKADAEIVTDKSKEKLVEVEKKQLVLTKEKKPEPKGEQKPESKAEQKSDSKAEQKSDSKAEQKSDSKAEQKSDSKEEQKPESKADQKSGQKPVTKSRPVASTPIPGTVWCVVQTNDGKHFFYDPSKRRSVWRMPEELKNNPDVEKLLPPKPKVKTENKEEKVTQEEPPAKKFKSEVEVKETKEKSIPESVKETMLEKETASAVLSLSHSSEVEMKETGEENIKEVEMKETEEENIKEVAKETVLVKEAACAVLLSPHRSELEEKEIKQENITESSKDTVLQKETASPVLLSPHRSEVEVTEAAKESIEQVVQAIVLEKETTSPVECLPHRSEVDEKETKQESITESIKETMLQKETASAVLLSPHRSEVDMKEVSKESINQVAQEIVLKKETTNEAEVQTAENEPSDSLKDRMNQFKELLAEKEVSALSTWEIELHKVVFDKRYSLLTTQKRQQAYQEYVKENVEREREEKNRIVSAYRQLLEENDLNFRSTYRSFAVKNSRDYRFRMVVRPRERETLFLDYMKELAKQEKEKNKLIREKEGHGWVIDRQAVKWDISGFRKYHPSETLRQQTFLTEAMDTDLDAICEIASIAQDGTKWRTELQVMCDT